MPQKLCTVCGMDVSTKKRIKDSAGNYYCEVCYAGKLADQRASDTDGDFQCDTCGRYFGVDDVYEDNGGTICKSCFARKMRPPKKAKPTPAAPAKAAPAAKASPVVKKPVQAEPDEIEPIAEDEPAEERSSNPLEALSQGRSASPRSQAADEDDGINLVDDEASLAPASETEVEAEAEPEAELDVAEEPAPEAEEDEDVAPQPELMSDEDAEPAPQPEVEPAGEAAPIQGDGAPAGDITEQEWHVYDKGENHGPFSVADLQEALAEGRFTTAASVWCEGMEGWQSVLKIESLLSRSQSA